MSLFEIGLRQSSTEVELIHENGNVKLTAGRRAADSRALIGATSAAGVQGYPLRVSNAGVEIKSHASYTGSETMLRTAAIDTADATATVIFSIPVPLSAVTAAFVEIVG
jgi:hypothetical protein